MVCAGDTAKTATATLSPFIALHGSCYKYIRPYRARLGSLRARAPLIKMSAEPTKDEWSDRVKALKTAVSNIVMDGDKDAVTHPRTLKRYVEAVRRSPLANQAEFYVLDVASAAGEPGLTIAHAFPQARVSLTDYSPAMLAWGKERTQEQGLTDRVTSAVANAEHMPEIRDASIDLVTCSYGLPFFDHVKGLREFRRVLKPGGLLLATNWARADEVDLGLILKEVAHALDPDAAPPLDACRLGDIPSFKQCLTAAGFDHAEVDIFNNPNGFVPGKAAEFLLHSSPLVPFLQKLESQGQENVQGRARTAVDEVLRKHQYLQPDGSVQFDRTIAHFYEARASHQ
ncbi:hypothetical protein WJX73_003985 [Symbiochloris irregularis]|uniref:Methyltransferase type 11 domain-containing protein n=1 Tax=Symbiochloris irregularis TaxID=706552 RepID=A0AAW1NKS2_9CHLO